MPYIPSAVQFWNKKKKKKKKLRNKWLDFQELEFLGTAIISFYTINLFVNRISGNNKEV